MRSAGNQIQTNFRLSEIIGIFYYCEENKSHNFFLGKQNIKLVNNTFCFPILFPTAQKLFQLTNKNHLKINLKVLKPHERNNLLFLLNIAKKILRHYFYAYENSTPEFWSECA